MHITRRDFLKLSGAIITLPLLPKTLLANTSVIPVLIYHDISIHFKDEYTISPALFAAQMEWLYSNGYTTLTFKEIENFIKKGKTKAIIITFDDGYASFMDYAFPLLREYNFKATINIIGKYVGSFIWMGGNRPMLSWDEYRYIINSGLIELGCHTFNLHIKGGVTTFSDKELRNDLTFFQETIEKEIGKNTEILAWPYGIYNERSIKIAKEAGFKYILTSKEGYLVKESKFHEIPRLNINNKIDLISFQQYIDNYN